VASYVAADQEAQRILPQCPVLRTADMPQPYDRPQSAADSASNHAKRGRTPPVRACGRLPQFGVVACASKPGAG
jgi:hypothetical protein